MTLRRTKHNDLGADLVCRFASTHFTKHKAQRLRDPWADLGNSTRAELNGPKIETLPECQEVTLRDKELSMTPQMSAQLLQLCQRSCSSCTLSQV